MSDILRSVTVDNFIEESVIAWGVILLTNLMFLGTLSTIKHNDLISNQLKIKEIQI